MRLNDLVGLRFGMLSVVSRSENKGRHASWLCRCDCGGEKVAISTNLVRGLTSSCGCLQRQRTKQANKTHGKSKSPVYFVWRNMLERCANKSDLAYGGRGISVCDKWLHSFETFYADMGEPPTSSHSIDRIDVNGNYEPSNCRWADALDQARNTRANRIIHHDGMDAALAQHCERLNLPYKTVHQRLRRGWDAKKALSTPVKAD